MRDPVSRAPCALKGGPVAKIPNEARRRLKEYLILLIFQELVEELWVSATDFIWILNPPDHKKKKY